MAGELGEKIGEGAFSDVHAWAPGQVVKLFKPEVRRRTARYEAHITRAVFEAGGPAQAVLDEVTIDGRLGMVLPRLDGPTLLQSLRADAITLDAAAEVLARLALSVHQAPTPADALPVRDYMDASLGLSAGSVPDSIAEGVLAMIDRLPLDDRLSHCDLHPGNVIMTP
ncbi:MAG: phosphotransferase, partial [Proteobacteria bacterium]|nr:phosphotransferase [Pseudomonadota bacterium]